MKASEVKELIKDIPEDEFIINDYSDYIGKCCVIGHLVRLRTDDPTDYRQSLVDGHANDKGYVVKIFRIHTQAFLEEIHNEKKLGNNIAGVNNCKLYNGYTQDTPKQRVMAMLDDMIEHGY